VGPNQLPIQCLPDFFFRDKSGQGVTLITHLHRLPKLRISGAIPLLPYVFMGWTETTLASNTYDVCVVETNA